MIRKQILQFFSSLGVLLIATGAFGFGVRAKHPQPKSSPVHARIVRRVPTKKAVAQNSEAISKWCKDVQTSVRQLHWNVQACKGLSWKQGGTSVKGRPLLYEEFGDLKAQNVTLVFASVHGDEITPVYIGLKLAHWLKHNEKSLGATHVILAPLVNPDGFFARPRTRYNAHGVDLNRNFATADWNAKALKAWRIRYRKNRRRFPGWRPNSEPETHFQVMLIRKFKPKKIISVHSPLNFMDYDGPKYTKLSLDRFSRDYIRRCLQLRNRVRAISSGYFPGSLGNYAGHERGIPTLTLELPTANPRMAEAYWKKFSHGIRIAIEFVIGKHPVAGKHPLPGKNPLVHAGKHASSGL